ncbi:hypothetical protein BDV59DRAFT_186614 [Aspergillus ambiguus]|uniref:uncharacterized protein n=1 Tax=Aspergillus ambiguus TaxID=176160 RepID=UPI003CCE2F10
MFIICTKPSKSEAVRLCVLSGCFCYCVWDFPLFLGHMLIFISQTDRMGNVSISMLRNCFEDCM